MNLNLLPAFLKSALHFITGLQLRSDTTHTLKHGTSVSSRLRFPQRVHRLSVAPPAGYYPVSEQVYRVSRHGYPSLQYVFRSVYVSIVVSAAVWTRPISV